MAFGGSGGGDTNIDLRDPKAELKTVDQWQNKNIHRYTNWRGNEELLGPATKGALGFFNNLNQLTNPLSALQSGLPAFYEGLQNQTRDIGTSLRSLVPGLQRTGNLFGQDIANIIQPVIAAGGYNKQTDHDAAQMARSAAAGAGALHTNAAIGQEVLGRQSAKDQRLALYSGLGSQLAGAQAGSLGAAGGLLSAAGQNVGLANALKSSQAGTTSSLSSGQSNLQTNALNQLLGVGSSAVSQWGGLTNPALSYLGNLFSNNLQANVAQADIAAKQDAASGAKASEGIGSVLSTIGPIIGAVAMSDERTKTDVKDTGMKTPEGIPVKTWEYKFRPGARFIGHTAQDIEKKVPGAVFTEPYSGIKFIDKKRFPMIEIESEVA